MIISSFTLNAHKKCIGQFNFNPLLYYGLNGQEITETPIKLEQTGVYTIKYKSGAICSYNLDQLPIKNNDNINPNFYYWNRYYQSSELTLGQYDVSYFPTSSILLGCFQCQFGTLPGFTDLGYTTRSLADTFNSLYLSNLTKSYNYTDQLSFEILQPQTLVFWYTNISEQSVEGSITYTIQYTSVNKSIYFLNDISILNVNKSDILKYSFQNYYLDVNKQNFLQTDTNLIQKAWIQDINNRLVIQNICDFNTVGYSSAYINNIKHVDTLNYEKKQSQLYYWQLVKKFNSKYHFIGKFNTNDPDLLLYHGNYSIMLAAKFGTQYKFSENIYNTNTGMTFLSGDILFDKSVYSFYIDTVDYFKCSFLCSNYDIYLYNDIITLQELNSYINNLYTDINFLTQYNEDILTTIQNKLNKDQITNITNIIEYNENNYNYYLDLSQQVYYNKAASAATYYIYSSQNIKNKLSIGPFDTLSAASSQIFNLYNDLIAISSYFICMSTQTYLKDKNSLTYEVKYNTIKED